MNSGMIKNYLGERVQANFGKYYENDANEITLESKYDPLRFVDGEIRSCYFKQFTKHQKRPGLIIHIDGINPLVMALGSTKDDGNWKKYKQNILVKDWKEEGLDKETYANTAVVLSLDEVEVYGHIGHLTQNDYTKIVKPVKEKIINDMISRLFTHEAYLEYLESVDPEGIFEIIKEDLTIE